MSPSKRIIDQHNFELKPMVLPFVILFGFTQLVPAGMFAPVQRHIALESQKLMLFEYGQPFKLHRRSRLELIAAASTLTGQR